MSPCPPGSACSYHKLLTLLPALDAASSSERTLLPSVDARRVKSVPNFHLDEHGPVEQGVDKKFHSRDQKSINDFKNMSYIPVITQRYANPKK